MGEAAFDMLPESRVIQRYDHLQIFCIVVVVTGTATEHGLIGVL
jgi:hypothetical protein